MTAAEAANLLSLSDAAFAPLWFNLASADKAALPDEVRLPAIDRYRRITPHVDAGIANLERQQAKRDASEKHQLEIPVGETAFALLERELPEPVRLCDPWCTEGLNIIAGRPKLGKTTLLRQKMAAMAAGAEFLDSRFPTPVIATFLSLEEGERIAKSKLKIANFPEAALAGIHIHYEWPRGREGVELLDRYLEANPDRLYTCIDSLTKFRTVPDARTPFDLDTLPIDGQDAALAGINGAVVNRDYAESMVASAMGTRSKNAVADLNLARQRDNARKLSEAVARGEQDAA